MSAAERIESLDVLRGVDALGIFVMNIQMFAMFSATLFNPTYYMWEGADYYLWYLSHVFADQKCMTIFSLLFGAGIVWLVPLSISPIWLRYFRYGPVEWLWRSLTYWERQSLRVLGP